MEFLAYPLNKPDTSCDVIGYNHKLRDTYHLFYDDENEMFFHHSSGFSIPCLITHYCVIPAYPLRGTEHGD